MTALALGPEVRVTWEGEAGLAFLARLYLQKDSDKPVTWNGWLCPAFRRDEVQRIMDLNREMSASVPETELFEWDGDDVIAKYPIGWTDNTRDGTTVAVAFERSTISPFVDDAGELRWPIGAWAWTWQYAEEEG